MTIAAMAIMTTSAAKAPMMAPVIAAFSCLPLTVFSGGSCIIAKSKTIKINN